MVKEKHILGLGGVLDLTPNSQVLSILLRCLYLDVDPDSSIGTLSPAWFLRKSHEIPTTQQGDLGPWAGSSELVEMQQVTSWL